MSDTPRTDAAIHLPIIHVSGSDDVVTVAFARQLERELNKAMTGLKDGQAAYDAALTKATCLRNKLLALREGVEKLAAEYTRLADTSDDEDFITEKRALARELRVLLK